MTRDYLQALPPLRFFGALFLVLFHLHALGCLSVKQPQLLNLVSKGYVGTSLFFVISGFILTHLYAQTPDVTPATFYWKRLTRLLPPYYLGLLLSVPVFLLSASAAVQPGVLLGQLALCLPALQAWVYGQATVLDAPGWSVSVLVFFYLLFPFLRTRVLQLSEPAVVRVCVLLWVVYLLPPTVYMLTARGPTIDNGSLPLSFLNTFPLFRLPELVLGMLAAALYRQRYWQRALSRPSAVWIGFGLLVGIMALIPEPNPAYPLFHNGLLTPLLMACVVSLAYHRGVLARLGTSVWAQRLGNASLNIFLLHLPLIAYYGHFVPEHQPYWTGLQIVGFLLVVIALGLGVEAFVTAPLMRRLRTSSKPFRFTRRPNLPPTLAAAGPSPHSQPLESKRPE